MVYVYEGQECYVPLARIDERGEVVWRGRFSTWGETERESATSFQAVPQNLRFQGQYLDRDRFASANQNIVLTMAPKV